MLKGEYISLRPVKKSDLSYFLNWFNDPEVIQFLDRYLPMTDISEEKWIEENGTSQTQVVFVIEVVESGMNTPIGTTGLHRINTKDRDAIFGIIIGEKDYWGHGYGTEAARLLVNYGFQQLNLHRISSVVYAFNERSLRLHKNLGFEQEGLRRKAVFKNGRYFDVVEFGVLAAEYQA